MIDSKVAALINAHVPYEAAAANAYYEMSLCADQLGLHGCKRYFRKAAREEEHHMKKMLHFLNKFNQPAEVPARDANPVERYTRPEQIKDLFLTAQQMEAAITDRIKTLRRAARDADDEESLEFLRWFVKEQTESEETIRDILNSYSAAALLDFDERVNELV